jgi:type II secretory pathway predicted ATPase ExeA
VIGGATMIARATFGLEADPDFIFHHGALDEIGAELMLSHLSERRGLFLVLGETGSGKTTFLLSLQQQSGSAAACVYLSCRGGLSYAALLETCCLNLGVSGGVAADVKTLEGLLSDYLDERSRAGATTMLLIDDAEDLAEEGLTGLAQIAAGGAGPRRLLQIVLAADPAIEAALKRNGLEPGRAGLANCSRLEPVQQQEVEAYIQHRLKVAGHEGPLPFSTETLRDIAAESGGLPARINELCRRALQFAGTESAEGTGRDPAPARKAADRDETPGGSVEGPGSGIVLARLLKSRKAGAPPRDAPHGFAYGRVPAQDGPWPIPLHPEAEEGTLVLQPEEAPGARSSAWGRVRNLRFAAGLLIGLSLGALAAALLMLEPAPQEVAPKEQLSASTGEKLTLPPEPAKSVEPQVSAEPGLAMLERAGGEAKLATPVRKASPQSVEASLLNESVFPSLQAPEITLPPDAERPAMTGGDGDDPGLKLAEGSSKIVPQALDTGERDPAEASPTARPASLPSPPLSPPGLSVQDVRGPEDTPIPLKIGLEAGGPGTLEKLSLVLADMPEGARLSAGRLESDGLWHLGTDDLQDLAFLPPANFSGQVRLTARAFAQDQHGNSEETTAEFKAAVTGTADRPALVLRDAEGLEDGRVELNIAAELTDDDGSERLFVSLAGLPEGARLTAGEAKGGGRWSLRPEQLPGLGLVPPPDLAGRIELSVSATAIEYNGANATQTGALRVILKALADDPLLQVEDAAGSEGAAIPLEIHAAPADRDGSESLVVTLAGLPPGGGLSAGRKDDGGSWTLTQNDLAGLRLTPPPDFAGRIELTVRATAAEPNGDSATSQAKLEVAVEGTPDLPRLRVRNTRGTIAEGAPLDIEASLSSAKGSQRLFVTIEDLPEGARLSAGVEQGDGRWTLLPDQLPGLRLEPSEETSGRIQLSVSATAVESDGTSATATASLVVLVEELTLTPPTNLLAEQQNGDAAAIPDPPETTDPATAEERSWYKAVVDFIVPETTDDAGPPEPDSRR